MNKLEEKLLFDFKKSNKNRRLTIAKKYGFNTPEDYVDYLMGKQNTNPFTSAPEPKEIPTIHNVTILDATVSMSGNKYNNSCKGILKELDWIKEQKGINYTNTVIEFLEESYGRIRYSKTPYLCSPGTMQLSFYGAKGGNTPLYAVVVDILEELVNLVKPTDKVLVKIYTDGENNRLESERIPCSDLIKQLQSQGFTITFVATKGDLRNLVHNLDLEPSNCLEVENSGEGFKQAFERSLGATVTYTASVIAGEDVSKGFYKKLID